MSTKPHKHAELIKAWADGAEIEYFSNVDDIWKTAPTPSWSDNVQFRIKPEPKPDYAKYIAFDSCEAGGMTTRLRDISDINPKFWIAIIKITFDGETDKPKSVELL